MIDDDLRDELREAVQEQEEAEAYEAGMRLWNVAKAKTHAGEEPSVFFMPH